MDSSVRSEGQSEGPPTGMSDFRAWNFVTELITTNHDHGAVFFLARLFFHVQLNEEAWPVLFEFL